MQVSKDRKKMARRVRHRIRKKISGTAEKPRLAVFRSLKHIYAQAIDDATGTTLAQCSTRDPELRSRIGYGGNLEAAKQVGATIATRLKEAKVDRVVFDRGGVIYHGRVKALAEAIRAGGFKF
jgi:large subunit ribosomal protein L18